jgi:hypothetical protein
MRASIAAAGMFACAFAIGCVSRTHTGAVTCDFKTHAPVVVTTEEIDVRDAKRWRRFDIGIDAVYADEGVDDAAIEAAKTTLSTTRAAYVAHVPFAPKPTAIALLRAPTDNAHASGDADGRAIWPIAPGDDDTAWLLAHEWTHSALHAARRSAGWTGERFLEDGFCDLVALTTMRALGRDVTGALAATRQRIASARTDWPEHVDLTEMSSHFGTSSPEVICRADPRVGYAMGLAIWIDRRERPQKAIDVTFAAIARDPAVTFEHILEALGDRTMRVHDVTFDAADATIAETR